MANHLTQRELNAIKVTPYKDLRPSLRSGDLFFCSGRYLVSKLIQTATDSPWSHVGIIFVIKAIDRVLLLESVEDVGVRLAPLSKYLEDYEDGNPYKGALAVARCSSVTNESVTKIACFGTDELTRPYDKEDIGRIVARIALGIGKRVRDRSYICSELVAECFGEAKIKFTGDGDYVTPEDVWVNESVKLLGRVQ